MCEKGGRRCAGHTGRVCAVALAEYEQAHPHGPEIHPLVVPETNVLYATLSTDEQDMLVAAGVEVLDAHQDLSEAQANLAALRAREDIDLQVMRARLAEYNQRWQDTLTKEQAARSDRINAEDALVEATLDKLEAAGLPAGDRGYFRKEMWNRFGRTGYGENMLLMHSLPEAYVPEEFPELADTVAAARQAAAQDGEYQRLRAVAQRAFDAHEEQRQALSTAVRELDEAERKAGWYDMRERHADDERSAEAQRDAARAALQRAEHRARLTSAQVASGVGAYATHTTAADLRADAVVINPDGTTNLWVYRDPDQTHKDGSFTPVTKIVERPGQPGVYEFDLADGTTVTPIRHEEYRGNTVYKTTGDVTLAVVDPQPGARRAVPSDDRPTPFSVVRDW